MSDPIQEMRVRITEIGRLLFDRNLTDAAGGNISARVGDTICITPRYSGSKYQWQLRPEQVITSDLQGNFLSGEGQISREAKVHFRLYREFLEGKAVVHAHARNALVFAANCRPIEPVLEDTIKFGTIKVAEFAPAHSDDLAEFVCRQMQGQGPRIQVQAAGVLATFHGLFVMGKSLEAAFDAVERIDTNAYILLYSRLLPGETPVSPEIIRQNIENGLQRYS